MKYDIVIAHNNEAQEGWYVDNIEEARNEAQSFVEQRMQAFGEDREALKRYGYLKAEEQAIDMGERGDLIALSDGWSISVKPATKR
jgi:hypothetical protein